MYEGIRVVYSRKEAEALLMELRQPNFLFGFKDTRACPVFDVLMAIPSEGNYPALIKYSMVTHLTWGPNTGHNPRDYWTGFYTTVHDMEFFARELEKRKEQWG